MLFDPQDDHNGPVRDDQHSDPEVLDLGSSWMQTLRNDRSGLW